MVLKENVTVRTVIQDTFAMGYTLDEKRQTPVNEARRIMLDDARNNQRCPTIPVV